MLEPIGRDDTYWRSSTEKAKVRVSLLKPISNSRLQPRNIVVGIGGAGDEIVF